MVFGLGTLAIGFIIVLILVAAFWCPMDTIMTIVSLVSWRGLMLLAVMFGAGWVLDEYGASLGIQVTPDMTSTVLFLVFICIVFGLSVRSKLSSRKVDDVSAGQILDGAGIPKASPKSSDVAAAFPKSSGIAGAFPKGSDVAPTVSASAAPIDSPLWTFGLEEAHRWLVQTRKVEAPPLMIIDFNDPHDGEAGSDREQIVDSLAFVLAEAFLMTTDMSANAVIFVNTDEGKLVHPVGSIGEYDDLLPFLDTLDTPPVVMWGSAGLDLESDGITVKIHAPGSQAERTLGLPLSELADSLIDLCVSKGYCTRQEAPAWWAPPEGEVRAPYSVMLDNLQLQILADRKNRAIPDIDSDLHEEFADLAFETAERFRQAGGQVGLTALITALYAERAGKLTDKHRRAALDILRRLSDKAHPAYRLSPFLFSRFGRGMEARARLSELRGRAEGAYAEWLGAIKVS